MRYDLGLNMKALVFGAAIAGACVLFGYQYWEWFYPFAAIGLLYAGYGQDNIKVGTLMGALASTVIVLLAFDGYMGQFTGFFATETGILTITAVIIIVGAFVGFVGAWTKRSREKAKEEYAQKQTIGKTKNKNKKKKANAEKTKGKTTYVDKIFKK